MVILSKTRSIKYYQRRHKRSKFVRKNLVNQDAVIHLACISNDPSFELNPKLGKSINLDAFEPLVKISKK